MTQTGSSEIGDRRAFGSRSAQAERATLQLAHDEIHVLRPSLEFARTLDIEAARATPIAGRIVLDLHAEI